MISVELKRVIHLLNDIQAQDPDSAETAIDFDLVLLICDLVTLARFQIAKTISLEVEASQPFVVHLPENVLRQVLLNLLLNAAQAIERNAFGHICIKVDKSGAGLTIQVLDDGTGFSQHNLDSGNCQSDENSGLALVQKFVKHIGGSIELSNRLPHGGCVTILLPDECMAKNQ